LTKILTLAKYSFKENISNKIFNGIMMFGGVLIFMTMLLDELALYEGVTVIRDTGLFFTEFMVMFIVVYLSSTCVLKAIKEKSIYLVLTKGVAKEEYLTGTLLGMMYTIFFNVFVMGCVLASLIWKMGGVLDYELLLSFVFIGLKLSLLSAVGIMFSVVSESYVTAILFTVSTYIAGHGLLELKEVAEKVKGSVFEIILNVLYTILPKFHLLNYRDYLFGTSVDLLLLIGYILLYVTAVLFIATLSFSRKRL
jgi:hypothetical protein